MQNLQLTDREYTLLIFLITSRLYSFAVADSRFCGFDYDGDAYQLMPAGSLPDDEFFDWYCIERVNDQFFPTKQDCALMFLKYWHIWNEKWPKRKNH